MQPDSTSTRDKLSHSNSRLSLLPTCISLLPSTLPLCRSVLSSKYYNAFLTARVSACNGEEARISWANPSTSNPLESQRIPAVELSDLLSTHEQSTLILKAFLAGETHCTGGVLFFDLCFPFDGFHLLKFSTCVIAASTMEFGSGARSWKILLLRDFQISRSTATTTSFSGKSNLESRNSVSHAIYPYGMCWTCCLKCRLAILTISVLSSCREGTHALWFSESTSRENKWDW